MCNCTTIEDYLKRHIRYNHLICKDDIIEKLYQLHYPPEKKTIATQTDITWVEGEEHTRSQTSQHGQNEDFSDDDVGMDDGRVGDWEGADDDGFDGEEEVLCPACGDVEDGTAMIACDLCDKW